MDISLRWLNRYLSPDGAGADEVEHALTYAGFPIEARRALPGGDVFMDVEITSNRGDCLSHIGLAREVAARGDVERTLVLPTWADPPTGAPVGDSLALENTAPGDCPRFTARLIRGVRIGPSPAWLVDLLEAVGQRSINNVVDVTNWLTLEYGNPSHVFDLAKLAGDKLVVRWATEGEKLTTLDGKARVLKADELVVADGERAQSLAGVIGGADSEVSEGTTDIVLEVACWNPIVVRRAARRHNVRTDAGHRFERGVDARTLEEASRRASAMIIELAGGELAEGMLVEGAPAPEPTVIDMRPTRCAALIGVDIPVSRMIEHLRSLEIDVQQHDEDTLQCTMPAFRLDLTREIDLIEEVARAHGVDTIPTAESLPVVIAHPQESERGAQRLANVLTGLGFYETITFSFVAPADAEPFLPQGLSTVAVDDDRRKAEPTLRPSLLPSLLACRKANRDAQVHVDGGVRLFETASVFAEKNGESVEFRSLGLLMDVADGAGPDDVQEGIRVMRGVIDEVTAALTGATADVEPSAPTTPAWDAGAHATFTLDGERLGQMGLLQRSTLARYDLEHPVVCAELALDPLLTRYPPRAKVTALPAFPGIDRDLSLVVNEDLPWSALASLVRGVNPAHLVACSFVDVFRGKQVGAGRKSVTMRLTFRDESRTLRHDEVDPGVDEVIVRAKADLGAELRV